MDLVELERHLRHEFAKPELSFHLRLFRWLGETSSGSNALGELIEQKVLESDVETRLKSEIRTPVQAAGVLQKLQMAVTFIVNSRDVLDSEVLGNMKLSDYLHQVLQEQPDSLQSATAEAEVKLRHVDDFVRLLKSVIQSDPMEGLPDKYRQELAPELQEKVHKLATKLSVHLETILRAMVGVVAYLADGGQKEDQKMVDWIPPYLEYSFSEVEAAHAVETNFPEDLQLAHFEKVYNGLKTAMEDGSAAGGS